MDLKPLITDVPLDILRWQEEHSSDLTYVYQLACPIAMTIRYIGISKEPYKRFLHHLKADTKSHRSSWIKNLNERGLRPFVFICEGFENSEDAKSVERKAILAGKQWLPLTNLTDGGDGAFGHPVSAKRRELYRQRMLTNNPSFGGLSEQHKRRITRSTKLATNRPEIRRKRSNQAKLARRGADGRFI